MLIRVLDGWTSGWTSALFCHDINGPGISGPGGPFMFDINGPPGPFMLSQMVPRTTYAKI